MTELLKELTDIVAPSGGEKALHELIIREISGYADEIRTDVMGNLIAHKKGSGKRIMFAAHADEIGFIITFIDDNGFLRFGTVGGIENTNILNSKVVFQNGVVGVIGCPTETEESAKNPKPEEMFIDIGAKDREEALKMVSVGDLCGFLNNYVENETTVISKSLDDRVGCYILIETLKGLKDCPNDLYFVFTSQEEIGVRGSTTSTFAISPDYALAVDVTDTGDTPDSPKSAVSLGGGIGIHVKDKRTICSPYMRELMVDTANELGLSYQMVVCEFGATDAMAMQTTKCGIPTGVLDVPTRYIHSPSEMIYKSDVSDCIKFLKAFATRSFE